MTTLTKNENFREWFGSFELLTYLKVRPYGWYLREMAFYTRQVQQQIDSIDPSNGRIDAQYYRNFKEAKDYSDADKINYCEALILLVPHEKFGLNVVRSEMHRREARLACLLEKYRLTSGHYPDALAEITDLPRHLNEEVLSGKPLHYSRKGDSYLLYSTGWDQKDRGGTIDTSIENKLHCDWVWPGP